VGRVADRAAVDIRLFGAVSTGNPGLDSRRARA
jgi:hypothetical protein